MEKIYMNHYSGLLEVKGEADLRREDTELWHETSKAGRKLTTRSARPKK